MTYTFIKTEKLQTLHNNIDALVERATEAEHRVLTLTEQVKTLDAQADIRNEYLDYLFTTFFLNLANPYVTRPTFDEPRCYHCHYPEYGGHAPDCAWLHCRPITSVLYPPPAKPDPDNTTFPAEPEDPEK